MNTEYIFLFERAAQWYCVIVHAYMYTYASARDGVVCFRVGDFWGDT
jgi:hypothetical protein